MKKTFILTLFSGIFLTAISQNNIVEKPWGVKHADLSAVQKIVLPGFNLKGYEHEDSLNRNNKSIPWRFGHNYFVNYSTANSGTWTTFPNGDKLWQLVLHCPSARSINIAFNDYELPKGARLFVYNEDHSQIEGPFTSENSNFADKLFGTTLISGEKIIIEYFVPATSITVIPFTIFRITHRYRMLSWDSDAVKSIDGFGTSGSCQVNVNCPVAAAWTDQKRSAIMLVTGGSGFCSASLIADVPHSGTPYVLTANHCGAADGTWVFWFNWESAGCANPSTNPSHNAVNGGTAHASNPDSDFHLCEMNSTPPASYNVFYSGWNRQNVRADSSFCIHHPDGDIAKFSKALTKTIDSTYSGAVAWNVGLWSLGCTEPGSSGSPLFDQDHRIIGQLFGGNSACGADSIDMNDFYGKFCASWDSGGTPSNELKEWLDPGNTGALTENGYDPNVASVVLDAGVLKILSPGGPSCNTSPVPSVKIQNHGSATLISATVKIYIDGTLNSTNNWSGSIASMQSAVAGFSSVSVSAGTHTIAVAISNPNGGTDGFILNDSLTQTFTILNPQLFPLSISDDFESGTFPKTNWTLDNPNNNETWTLDTTGGFGQSNTSIIFDNFNVPNDNSGQIDNYLTPFIDMSTALAPITLTFDVAAARYDGFNYDSLLVLGTSDCGTTWLRYYAKGGTGLKTAPDIAASLFVPTSTQWRKETVNLNSLAGQGHVQFAFQLKSGWGNATYIDNINIVGSAIGISENTHAIYAELFPNPASENVHINYSSGIQNGTIKIYDATGRIVQQQNCNSTGQTIVSLGNFSGGIYFVEISSAAGKTTRKLFVD